MLTITKTAWELYSDVFPGIGCFTGTFPLQVKENVKSNQALSRHIAYTLWQTFRKL